MKTGRIRSFVREVWKMDYVVYLLVLIVAFLAIVFWAFGRKRKARFKRDAIIPFDDRNR